MVFVVLYISVTMKLEVTLQAFNIQINLPIHDETRPVNLQPIFSSE